MPKIKVFQTMRKLGFRSQQTPPAWTKKALFDYFEPMNTLDVHMLPVNKNPHSGLSKFDRGEI